LCPDEHTGIKWNEVEDFLDVVSAQIEVGHDLLSQGKFSFRLKQEFGIEQITPCQSSQEPLVQLAVLAQLDAICKRKKLGVSLKTNHGLRTFDPANPVNFWWYESQYDEDKAPVKRSK